MKITPDSYHFMDGQFRKYCSYRAMEKRHGDTDRRLSRIILKALVEYCEALNYDVALVLFRLVDTRYDKM